jgi:N-acetylmuramoyl-L-alanine amidase
VKKKEEEKKSEIIKNNTPDSIEKATPKEAKDKEQPIKKEEKKGEPVKVLVPVDNSSSDDLLQWSVQFYTSPKPLADNSKIYDAFDDVREDFENGLYKYSTGLLSEKSEAIKLQTRLRQQGYKDAFLVAFLNNKKINIKEAIEKAKKTN